MGDLFPEDDDGFNELLTAFREDPADDEITAALERLAAATQRWVRLVHAANGFLRDEVDPARKVALCLRLAKWYAEDLGYPAHARPYDQIVLSIDPDSLAARRRMDRSPER